MAVITGLTVVLLHLFFSSLLSTPSPHKIIGNSNNITQMIVNNNQRPSNVPPFNVPQPQTSKTTIPLPDASQMDWTSLVDTATKAILSSAGEEESSEGGGGSEPAVNRRPRSVVAGGEEEEEVRRLLQRVSSLEAELAGERRGREQLGRQVDQLREENVRLQEESQTAAQQLRRFTEWFFQTIDKS